MNDNKIITTEDGEEINLTALEREFGSYEFEGKTYYAARQMEYGIVTAMAGKTWVRPNVGRLGFFFALFPDRGSGGVHRAR